MRDSRRESFQGALKCHVKKIWVIALMAVMLVLQIGCGAKDAGESKGAVSSRGDVNNASAEVIVSEEMDSGYVYVGMEAVLGFDDNWWNLMEARVEQDMLCYPTGGGIVYNALTGGAVDTKSLKWENAPERWNMKTFCFGADGSFYTRAECKVEDAWVNYLCKFDSAGNYVWHSDISEFLAGVGEVMDSQWEMEADGQGRIYLATDTVAGLFDADGSFWSEFRFDNPTTGIVDMVRDREGTLFMAYRNNASGDTYVAEMNFEEKKTANAAKVNGLKGICAGKDKGLLAYTEEKVYQYDVEAGTLTALFRWEDCNVNGLNAGYLDVLSDGRILAVESSTYSTAVTLITQMSSEEAAKQSVERKEITLGISSSSLSKDLSEAVVRFNKENDKYKVVTKNYTSEEGVIAGREQMLTEIIAGKGPDLILISFLDAKSLAEKGVFEDLNEYLKRSEKYSAEDFVDRLLELGTYDGKLVAIPHAFTMDTYMGSKDIVGEEMGWTLEEMLAVMKANPDMELLYGKTRLTLLNICISFNESSFIDWENGVCNFNSPEFITLLEITNAFPESNGDLGWGKTSLVTKIANDEVILADLYLKDFFGLQPYCDIFTEGYTCIGYPNSEGIVSRGNLEDMLAISSQSQVKDGAWEFLEYFYEYRRSSGNMTFNFPCLKSQLAELAEKSMTMDEEQMTRYTATDGVSWTNRHPTREEIDLVYKLIDCMQEKNLDLDVYNIIKEEVAAYYDGQKSVEAVAEIIQNRVQNYVDENR